MKNKILKLNVKTCLLFLFIGTVALGFTSAKYSLVGKWTIYDASGTSIGEFVDLKADNTYTVSLPDGAIGKEEAISLRIPFFLLRILKMSVAKITGVNII